MNGNPFTSSPVFSTALLSLMQAYGVPEVSVAADQGGQVYAYTQINDQFYTDHLLPVPAASSLTPDSLFRIESITKTFTSVAIMTLVQDHYLELTDSALADLGYSPHVPLKGFDPVSGKPVSIYLPQQLFAITVADLMDMTSGLPTVIPINSQTFTGSGAVQDLEGSYAALAFAGPPPYLSPATALEQINYFLYSCTRRPASITRTRTR
jgi:CubicO group peptidase (beta-lactamase class C family)